MKDIETKAMADAVGNLRVAYVNLTAEDFEMLKALNDSPYWVHYRKILEKAMAEYLRASTMVTDVNGVVKMVHNSGLAAGINFAINQIQVLCADYDAKKQKAIEKSTKVEKAKFTRG